MHSAPFLGVVFHAIGGLAAASFYLPYRRVRGWSWETYWIVGGLFSWLLAPMAFSLLIVPGTWGILRSAPTGALINVWLLGVIWGVGGLTFGLTMRYLGIALGYAVALGSCAAFGTLVPPIFSGQLGNLVMTRAGQWTLGGVALCLLGITFSGVAGLGKERELSEESKKATVGEFAYGKGIATACVCGLLSACMSFAFRAGGQVVDHAIKRGVLPLWAALPLLVVILFGGLTTNLIWSIFLNVRRGSFTEYLGNRRSAAAPLPLLGNYLFCALAGVTWYLQFFFYSMGESRMGVRLKFSSWTLHMASIIIFSTVWGLLLREWRGVSSRTRGWIAAGLVALVISTVVIGYGNSL